MIRNCTIALLLLLLLGGEKDKIRVTAMPRLGMEPQVITLTIVVEDPAFTCPSWKIYWSAVGNASSGSGDCDPDDPPEIFTLQRRSPIAYPGGTWSIRVTFEQAGKETERSAQFEVSGG